jgi:hypothetical protein
MLHVAFVVLALPVAGEPPALDVLDYGAVSDPEKDSTPAFQKALDAAGARGGTVRVPPGLYRLEDSLRVPTGVALEGSWQGPHHGAWKEGSTLLVLGGRGKESGPAAIEMAQSSAVRGFTVVYPEQTLESVQPYPWTVHGTGMHLTVENVTLVNSYNGIAMGPERNELHLIRGVHGCVLRRGVLIDGCTDIGRIENVHFNPHYWVRAQYPGTSGVWRVRHPDGRTETRHPQWYMMEHLEAFIFGRTDWEYVLNTFVFGANVGYRFMRSKSGSANGNFLGIGADMCTTCLRVEASQPMGILVTNGEFVGNPGCEAAVEVTRGMLALSNSSFWGHQKRNVSLDGRSASVTMNQCIFLHWDREKRGLPSVQATQGMLTLQGCSFLQDQPHISLGPGVRSAVILGNTFHGGPKITNEAKGEVEMHANVTPAPRT